MISGGHTLGAGFWSAPFSYAGFCFHHCLLVSLLAFVLRFTIFALLLARFVSARRVCAYLRFVLSLLCQCAMTANKHDHWCPGIHVRALYALFRFFVLL